ncbi:glutamate--tRNA ligase family protein [Candidatus Carsonella ruddii]|uniref:glutamate--tRNA ligase family protein n=1 Tax=Carsonella ruddii TaxID=114186 RepID=UPI003D9A2248
MINRIQKKIIKKSNFRFPPDPNGFLHIGHTFNILLNFYLSCIKKGIFFLRFDNTNLTNYNLYYYNFIKYDLLWLGIKWNKLEFFFNKIRIFFYILCFYFKNKKIYFKKKNILLRINFNYLNYKKIINIFLYKNNFFKKNQFVFILKKKIIFRKKNKKKHWNIFSTYDFSQSINDYLNKINISICTKEFFKNSKIYNYLLKKIKNKPYQIEFEKKNFKYKKFSKRKLKNVFFFNIFYLKKIGFNVKNLKYLCNIIGISKNISYLNYKIFRLSLKIEKNFYEKCLIYIKNNFLNLKKNLLISIFLNLKNINLNFNIAIFNKFFKSSFNKFNFLIINIFFIFKKKILLKKLIFLKNNFLFLKVIKNKKIKNFSFKNRHCLYDNKLKFKIFLLKK